MKQKEQEININKKNDTQTFHDKLKICIDTMEDRRCCINRQKVACHRISAGGTIFRKTTPNNFYEKVKISNT